MELVYKGKKTEEEILKIARLEKKDIISDCTGSLLVKGEAFAVLSSLAERYRGKVDLVYMDPPQNGFLSDGALRSKLKTEEYAEFLREKIVLAKLFLSDRGSFYLHISNRDIHMMKLICDEIFGESSFMNDITRVRSNPRNSASKSYGSVKDAILFYVKNPGMNIWNDVKVPLEEADYEERFNKTDGLGRHYATVPLHAPGETKNGATGDVWRGIKAPKGRHWMTSPEELDKLDDDGRIEWSSSGNPRLIVYADEYGGKRMQDVWQRYKDPLNPEYPGEKNSEMLSLIIAQSSAKDSTVLDMFAGSGAFLRCAESAKRNYIGIDSSVTAVDMIMAKAQRSYEYLDFYTGYSKYFPKTEAMQLSFFDEE